MAVTNVITSITHVENGVATNFSFDFKILADGDLRVIQIDLSGNESVIDPSNYTVLGSGFENGGAIVKAPATSGFGLRLERAVELTQLTRLRNVGTFTGATHEDTFDHLSMVDIQQQDVLDRALTLPVATPAIDNSVPAPEEGTVLGWLGGKLQNIPAAQATLTSNYLDLQNIGLLPSDSAALTVEKNPTDGANPNIVALFRNRSDSLGYDGEVHVRLQAGTAVSHRAYINFANFDGVDKWVTGRNAESCYILYNSETIHRLWMDPGVNGPDPSFRTGNTYLNSAEGGKIRLNWHPSDRTGLGGLEIWSGGNNGSGVTNNAALLDCYADAEPVGFTASTATNVLTVSSIDALMGALATGMCVVASGIAAGVYITGQLTGPAGGAGTYSLSATVGPLTSRHMTAFSSQLNIYGTKNAGVGTGAIVCFGGAYIARDFRVGGSQLIAGTLGVTGVTSMTQAILNKAAGSDLLKFQESGDTKWTYYAPTAGSLALFNSVLGAAAWTVDANSHFTFAATITTKVYTVAGLPAGVVGQRAFVSDATSETFRAAVVGGGAFEVPIHRTSSGWKVG